MSVALGCGACSLCCSLLGVPDIGKPARMRCWHTTVHGGCAVHADKGSDPNLLACSQFKCVWLASQDREDRLPRSLRPDQCHVVLGPQDRNDDTLLYVQVDPAYPSAWKKGLIASYLSERVARGAKLEIIIDETRTMLSDGSTAICP